MFIDPAGSAQCRQLSETVSAGGIGLNCELLQYFQHRQADGADSRLGNIGSFQGLFLPLPFFSRCAAGGKIKSVRWRRTCKFFIDLFQDFHGLGKCADKIASHSKVLASLSRKHKSQFSRLFQDRRCRYFSDSRESRPFLELSAFNARLKRSDFCEFVFINHQESMGMLQPQNFCGIQPLWS